MSLGYCEKCGATLHVGDFPFCRGGHSPAQVAVHPDDLIGGFWQENFGDQPEYFTSKKAMLARADALGLRQVSDGDRKKGGFTVTAKMLADAKALLERGVAADDSHATLRTAAFSIREIPCS